MGYFTPATSIKRATLWENDSSLLHMKNACNRKQQTAECENVDTSVRRGDIYYADLSPVVGSEQGGIRPVLIIQNDMGNRHSPTVIAAAITSQMNKARLPTHIELINQHCGLTKDSVVLLEQIRTLDKRRLRERMGHLEGEMMERVDRAIAVSFGIVGMSAVKN